MLSSRNFYDLTKLDACPWWEMATISGLNYAQCIMQRVDVDVGICTGVSALDVRWEDVNNGTFPMHEGRNQFELAHMLSMIHIDISRALVCLNIGRLELV